MTASTDQENLDCCVAGGGPAGMLLGFLLARAGITVLVMEQHKDFFRDFRGDTIHPSTMQIMHELGLLQEFLKLPHQEIERLYGIFNGRQINIADFTHLAVAKPAIGLMPQWDFLNFIANRAKAYSTFSLKMEYRACGLIMEQNRVIGVKVETPEGPRNIKARLIVVADGRHSTLRQAAGLKVIGTSAPVDVIWFRLSRQANDPQQTLGRFLMGSLMILLNRDSYWQCAYVIEKGGFEVLKQNGLESLKAEITRITPFLSNRLGELKSWDDIQFLSVAVDRLEKWYTDGLICIGDAAHAMSPIGGVGINLALQDAVAAANILFPQFKQSGVIDNKTLQKIQERRVWPTKVIQLIQIQLQKGLANRQKNRGNANVPFFLRMLNSFPLLRRIPARIVGLGIRPEHVQTPDINQ